MKNYIVYKTVNLINNKYYIGVHKQLIDHNLFDGYFGSGKLLKRSIKKYGEHNFVRLIIDKNLTKYEAYNLENKLVSLDEVNCINCYNLALGGNGGFYCANNKISQNKAKLTKLQIYGGGMERFVHSEISIRKRVKTRKKKGSYYWKVSPETRVETGLSQREPKYRQIINVYCKDNILLESMEFTDFCKKYTKTQSKFYDLLKRNNNKYQIKRGELKTKIVHLKSNKNN